MQSPRIKSGSIATTLQEHQNKLELLQKLLSNVGLSVPSNAADEDPMQVDVPKVTEAIAANASSILQVKRGSAGPETVWNGVLEWARAEAQILQSLLEETMDEQNVESIAVSLYFQFFSKQTNKQTNKKIFRVGRSDFTDALAAKG